MVEAGVVKVSVGQRLRFRVALHADRLDPVGPLDGLFQPQDGQVVVPRIPVPLSTAQSQLTELGKTKSFQLHFTMQ